ncbi:MAG: NAD(+) synthase [Eubacteriales bacterium]
MRDYEKELKERVAFIKKQLVLSQTTGIIFGNSGGKDSMLVGILCKKACDNTVGIIMPCGSNRNYNMDLNDAQEMAQQYSIESRVVDLTAVRDSLLGEIVKGGTVDDRATNNVAPRLRMTTLYTIGTAENRVVAGTGNRSEGHMGYFTKWGDGAFDFNPISDLTATEILAFLKYLGAPEWIQTKAPSAGLFDGQTDEQEMGVTYAAIDRFLETGEGEEEDLAIIARYHRVSQHKRRLAYTYSNQ